MPLAPRGTTSGAVGWRTHRTTAMRLRPAVTTVSLGRRCPSVAAALVVLAAVALTGCESSSTVTTTPTAAAAGKCQLTLTAPPMMDAAGGNSTFSVSAEPECSWNASTSVSWISGVSPTSGQGNGSVAFRVAANEGTSSRDGDIAVNESRVHISQRAPCRFDLAPANQGIGLEGGAGSVAIAAASECSWTATSDVEWITLTPPIAGSGNGTVRFTVLPNSGAERTGSVGIGSQRATVSQSGTSTPAPPGPPSSCTSSINPTSQNVAAAGGTGSVGVSTSSGCGWTASSGVTWITITSGATGTGSGSVGFAVAPNTGGVRTGTLTISGHAFTVMQAAAGAPNPSCTFSLSSAGMNVAAAGGTGGVTVTAGNGCAWTAASGATWITIIAGASGTGNGSVAFSVAAN